jgi:hypothetical protein
MKKTGIVTAISHASISVRSEDGYTQTYVIPRTAGPNMAFAVNDQVVIRGTRRGPTVLVTDISMAQGGGPPASHRN